MRLAVVRPQRHELAKGIDGRRLLVQGQLDFGQAPHVHLAEATLRHSLVRGCRVKFLHRGIILTHPRIGPAMAYASVRTDVVSGLVPRTHRGAIHVAGAYDFACPSFAIFTPDD